MQVLWAAERKKMGAEINDPLYMGLGKANTFLPYFKQLFIASNKCFLAFWIIIIRKDNFFYFIFYNTSFIFNYFINNLFLIFILRISFNLNYYFKFFYISYFLLILNLITILKINYIFIINSNLKMRTY